MPLKNPRIIFGVHSFTPYDRDTGLPYGTSLVLGDSSYSLSGELETLTGGSNKYPWAVEETNITAELSLTVRQYENWMFQLFLGKAPTTAAQSTTGTISSLQDKKGTIVNSTWGIASVGIASGSENDLKFTKFIVEVFDKTLDQVHVYAVSNVDFARGTDKNFVDNTLRITETPLTISDGAATPVPGFGVELTGGSTVDFEGNGVEDGDTATFEVVPPDRESIFANFGGSADTFPEFGAIVTAQKRGSGEMFELDIYRLKAVGLPLGFQEKTFSEAEITAQSYYDAERNAVFGMRYLNPLTPQ